MYRPPVRSPAACADAPPIDPDVVAGVILDGFDRHYRLFRRISAGARERFDRADWIAVAFANRERIEFYDQRVNETVERLNAEYPALAHDESAWPAIKIGYIGLLHQHLQPECAETFFNSVACHALHQRYYDNAHIFWRPSVATDYLEGPRPAIRSFYPATDGLRRCLLEILNGFELASAWEDLRRDVRRLASALRQRSTAHPHVHTNHQLQVLGSLFYRNKGAYVVGRLINGAHLLPVVISILKAEDGRLRVDALLTDETDVALLFSFARAYFMVDMDTPAAYVDFLQSLMPTKPRNELYSLLGLQKHAKTLFYRELHHHLKYSRDSLQIADGIRGMVMLVFTLPSFPFVFKVIRDRFDPPKTATREEVREKYQLVKFHDRVGRLADTLEFSHVALPLKRFGQELRESLLRDAAKNVRIEGDRLIVKHVYIERRMVPLNRYLATADGDERHRVIDEYGQAIRELAGAGVFPGDMMLKNFGVTRQGRVVFYDYDEICYLHECRFRRIPPDTTGLDGLGSEAWFSTRPEDVFPETFDAWFFSTPNDKALFRELHGDLAHPDFWREQQRRIRANEQSDLFPYPQAVRLGTETSGCPADPSQPDRASQATLSEML